MLSGAFRWAVWSIRDLGKFIWTQTCKGPVSLGVLEEPADPGGRVPGGEGGRLRVLVFGFPGYQLPEDPMPARVKSGFTGEKNMSVPTALCPCPRDPGEDALAWGVAASLGRQSPSSSESPLIIAHPPASACLVM